MFSTMLSTRTMIMLGFALLIGSPALAGSHKVQVCHVPDGNPANAHEISVSANAADAHLRNHEGDTLGPCPAPVACPCWTDEDLRAALEVAAASPDVTVEFCDLFVDIQFGEIDATLSFESEDGDVFVDVDSFDDEAECEVDVFDLDVGLEPSEMDISVEEASECASIIGAICLDLLP
jgi:hypothetical protein